METNPHNLNSDKGESQNQELVLRKIAKSANFADLQTENIHINSNIIEDDDADQEYLKTTPLIPHSVYDNLPQILLESCKVFTEQRSRDTFLTGALAILSGCLPNVSGSYSGSTVYPNLFSFILAPAASGKGSLNFAKSLADGYHDKILSQNIVDKRKYDEEISILKKGTASTNIGGNKKIPQKPNFRVAFIPANTSNSKIIQHLDSNWIFRCKGRHDSATKYTTHSASKYATIPLQRSPLIPTQSTPLYF